MKELLNKVKEVRRFAKAAELEKIVYWCDQAIYMIETYAGTVHEAEVKADIEIVLSMLDGTVCAEEVQAHAERALATYD